MKTRFLPLIFLLFSSTAVNAADFYILHGVNGADLGLSASLPVDVRMNGSCIATNVPFKTLSQKFQTPAGSFEMIFTLSTGASSPCSGTTVGHFRMDLSINESATLVAHLDPQGAVRLTKFTNDQQVTDGAKARITVRHAAAAPPVNVNYRIRFSGKTVKNLRGGSQSSDEVGAGTYRFTVSNTETRRQVFNTESSVAADENLIAFVIGSAKRGSIEILWQRLMTPAN